MNTKNRVYFETEYFDVLLVLCPNTIKYKIKLYLGVNTVKINLFHIAEVNELWKTISHKLISLLKLFHTIEGCYTMVIKLLINIYICLLLLTNHKATS